MSITDELREYTEKQIKWLDMSKVHYRKLFAIADRIDAEHEREMQRMWDEAETFDLAAFDATHIELPKDADGVPWNVGDCDEDGDTVAELRLTSSGWCVLTDGGLFYHPDSYRHCHAPTVEDVLREFADIVRKERVELATISEDTIAEFAKRLTLAGGAE